MLNVVYAGCNKYAFHAECHYAECRGATPGGTRLRRGQAISSCINYLSSILALGSRNWKTTKTFVTQNFVESMSEKKEIKKFLLFLKKKKVFRRNDKKF